MRYRVRHTTSYDYGAPVAVSHHVLRLEPRATACQAVIGPTTLTITPQPERQSYGIDYHGNRLRALTIQQNHRALSIDALSTVTVNPPEPIDADATPAWETVRDLCARAATPQALMAADFAFASPYTPGHAALHNYALASFTPGRSLVAAALELTTRIFSDFTYDPKATEADTPVLQAFEQKRGVCQDFAHVMLSCLRALHLPARYVSGYVRTYPAAGTPRMVGADASHAWVAVWLPQWGWIDFDPTNNKIPSDEHITLGWGRDYGDINPVAGVVFGGGSHAVRVAVDVEPLDSAAKTPAQAPGAKPATPARERA